jgi:hypothetical protein
MRIDSIDLNKSLNQTWIKLKEIGQSDVVFPRFAETASVTIDGNRAAIPLINLPTSNGLVAADVINIYELEKNSWNLKYSIPEPANARDGSGTYWGRGSTVLSGDYLYVAAYNETNVPSGSGAIHIYKRNPSNGSWLFHTMLTASSGGSFFGRNMDVSGDVIIDSSGYIFTRNPATDTWAETNIFTPVASDGGSPRVAISGDNAIMGYPFATTYSGPVAPGTQFKYQRGHVYVFTRNPATGTWSLQQTILGNDHNSELFGYAIAISGDYFVASSNDGSPSTGLGNQLHIYKRDPNLGSWSLQQQQTVNTLVLTHLSMSDDHIILGMSTDATGGTNSGTVNVYTRDGTSWTLTQRIIGELVGYYFGNSVHISGTNFLVHQAGPINLAHGTIHFYNLQHSLEVSNPISVSGTTLSFTGQHLCSPEGPMSQGLVVSANKNRYTTLNGPLATGSRAIRSSEALPVVSLSESQNDRSVFGVVDRFESDDGTTRNQTQGATIVMSTKEIGDQKVIVNSLGEGAVWVVNTNGAVVSGDYLTTSNVSGYTQKQDDDILHNYTVAKITMDCDFNPVDLPVQVIKKKENGENDLDQYGRIQWEDTEHTEKSYHLRYLTTDGTVTDEANAVWTAAYVGCTYHCG